MYQEKLDAALTLIEAHNSSLGEGVDKVDADGFVTSLKNMGGTSEQALAACTWEDLQDCGLPRILARSVANAFRVEDKQPQEQKIVVVDDDPVKHAARLKPAELIDHYDPEEPDNPYGERLGKLSKGLRIIVFNDDGSLNAVASKNELQRIRDNRDERGEVRIEGVILKTYKVGQRPDRYVDEHPLFKGEPLESDGSSDNGIAWGTIPFRIRQLVHIAVQETGELDTDRYEEIDIFDILDGKDWAKVASRYQRAAVRFKELEKLGELPKLKVQLGENGAGGRRNDPFHQHTQY